MRCQNQGCHFTLMTCRVGETIFTPSTRSNLYTFLYVFMFTPQRRSQLSWILCCAQFLQGICCWSSGWWMDICAFTKNMRCINLAEVLGWRESKNYRTGNTGNITYAVGEAELRPKMKCFTQTVNFGSQWVNGLNQVTRLLGKVVLFTLNS